jgi:PKD repeat protein
VVGQSVTFTDASVDPDGTIVARAWDVDDDGQFDDGTGTSVSRTFTSTGSFTVRVRVTDDDQAMSTGTRTVTVAATPPANQPPTASFTVSPGSPQTGEAVTFTDTSTDGDGTISARAWDTDDDGQYDDGTGTTATRTFTVAGPHTVRLRVTDDDQAQATTSRQVTVAAPPSGTNLLTNPSFEVNLGGWGSWQASLARVTGTGAPDGAWFARATRSSGTSFTIDDAATSITSTVAGRTYTATAWARAGSAGSVGKTAQLKLRERTSGGTVVADAGSPQITLTTSWQKLTVTRTAAAAGNTLGVRVSVGNAASGTVLDADLFVVTGTGP